MIFRKAQPSDRPKLIKIWGDVFGDSEEVSGKLLDDFAGPDNVYVAEENDEVISQLLAVPCEAAGEKGAYLYALATVKEYRSRGVMGKLMDHAEEQIKAEGRTFFILIPASASLFDYYKAHGFEDVCMQNLDMDMDTDSRDDFEYIKDDIRVGEIPVDLFMDLRSRYGCVGTVTFSPGRTLQELKEQWYYGCGSVYCHKGYAMFKKVDELLFITEVAAADDSLAIYLIEHAGKLSGCEVVKVTLPSGSKLLGDKEYNVIQTPQAQYRWWGEGDPPRFYLRFAMDDLPARLESNKKDMIL